MWRTGAPSVVSVDRRPSTSWVSPTSAGDHAEGASSFSGDPTRPHVGDSAGNQDRAARRMHQPIREQGSWLRAPEPDEPDSSIIEIERAGLGQQQREAGGPRTRLIAKDRMIAPEARPKTATMAITSEAAATVTSRCSIGTESARLGSTHLAATASFGDHILWRNHARSNSRSQVKLKINTW